MRTMILLLAASNALAQQSVIDHCRQASSDAERIACLEAALLRAESSTVAVDGIGADQVIAKTESAEEKRERLEKAEGLLVSSYQTVPYEKLQLTLANGQVWRQINGDTQIIRVDLKRNQTVDIEESSLGGYKIHLKEMRRTIRAERVQ